MKLGSNPSAARAGAYLLAPGSVLDGRFAIVDTLRTGGMATIFKARDLLNGGRWVAVKIPHPSVEMDAALFSRFQHEGEIGCRLDHPSIVRFFPVENKSRSYLVMEFLEGMTLYHWLKEHRAMPEKDALALMSRICEPLRYLHKMGVLHRDLKPENIMLCADGSLRLMDFGIARLAQARRLTFIGFAPGTPHYMAPERVNGKRGDERTDVYSLGAVLYEMLTGVIAFASDDMMDMVNARVTGDPVPLRKINPAVSEAAEEIVLQAMERDPAKRYPSIVAMQAELDHPDAVVLTGRWRRLQPSTPWKRGLRKARTIALWGFVPLVLQVLLFFWLWHHLSHGHAHAHARLHP